MKRHGENIDNKFTPSNQSSARHKDAMQSVRLKEQSRIIWQQIQNGEWEYVRTVIHSPQGLEIVRRKHFNGATILSCALGYDPPLDVVTRMIEIYPEAVSTKGVRGRLPLHVACACSASKEVIDFLISNYCHATISTDEEGKTPLHYIVESYCQDSPIGVSSASSKQRRSSYEAVKAVIVASPYAVMVPDKTNSETPLDFAHRIQRDDDQNRQASLVTSFTSISHFQDHRW